MSSPSARWLSTRRWGTRLRTRPVASLEGRPPRGEAILAAAARDDVLNLAIGVQRFNLDIAEMLLAVPRPLCRELVDLAGFLPHPKRTEFCRDPDTLPDGDHARQTWSITRELVTAVFPRTSVLPPHHLIREEELLAWNTLILPEVRRAVADAGARAARLDPPPELHDDHQALLDFSRPTR